MARALIYRNNDDFTNFLKSVPARPQYAQLSAIWAILSNRHFNGKQSTKNHHGKPKHPAKKCHKPPGQTLGNAHLIPECQHPGGAALTLDLATRGLSIAYVYDHAASHVFTFDHEVFIFLKNALSWRKKEQICSWLTFLGPTMTDGHRKDSWISSIRMLLFSLTIKCKWSG